MTLETTPERNKNRIEKIQDISQFADDTVLFLRNIRELRYANAALARMAAADAAIKAT